MNHENSLISLAFRLYARPGATIGWHGGIFAIAHSLGIGLGIGIFIGSADRAGESIGVFTFLTYAIALTVATVSYQVRVQRVQMFTGITGMLSIHAVATVIMSTIVAASYYHQHTAAALMLGVIAFANPLAWIMMALTEHYAIKQFRHKTDEMMASIGITTKKKLTAYDQESPDQ